MADAPRSALMHASANGGRWIRLIEADAEAKVMAWMKSGGGEPAPAKEPEGPADPAGSKKPRG
jgi:hypothetical protein